MIDVTIMGPRGGRVKDIDEALIYNYIIEACKELKIRQADIEVLVYNKFPSDYDYAIGFCYGDVESVTIELTKEDDNMFQTLAHEMIHVKQYMTQNLGKLLDENFDMPYADRWWEEEAFSNAIPLVTRFSNLISL